MGQIVGQEPCPKCRAEGRDSAGDNLCEYDDGSKHCHACEHDEQPQRQGRKKPLNLPTPQEIVDTWAILSSPARGWSKQAAEFFGVRTIISKGKPYAHAYPVTKLGVPSGFQVRKLPKEFGTTGDCKNTDLFGQAQAAGGGQMLIVCEGADDTLAAKDMLLAKGKNYKVVGSLGAKRWKHNIEFMESFDKVIVAFDSDEPGQEGAQALSDALTPGKARIMKLPPDMDVNDLLHQKGGADTFFKLISEAKVPEVDGIVSGEAAWTIIKDYKSPDFVPYPSDWGVISQKMQGLREAEISIWTAGSSIGKTAFMRRIKQHVLTTSDWKIADLELEERVEKTIRGMMQFQAGMPMFQMTSDQKRAAWQQTYGTGRLFTLNHRANQRGQSLLGKFRYLHHAHGVKLFFLDHVTLGVREFGDGNEGQDAMMEDFLTFVEQTGCHLALISHLRKPPGGGKSWSQGAIPSEEDMKGSGSLYQIAFDIVGISRNKQHDNEYLRNVSTLHGLKCRETGQTGPMDQLYYESDSGLLVPADDIIDQVNGEQQGGDF